MRGPPLHKRPNTGSGDGGGGEDKENEAPAAAPTPSLRLFKLPQPLLKSLTSGGPGGGPPPTRQLVLRPASADAQSALLKPFKARAGGADLGGQAAGLRLLTQPQSAAAAALRGSAARAARLGRR